MKLTWWNKCLIAGLLTCTLAGAAHAQAPGGQGGRGRGGPGGPGGGFGGRGGGTSLISLASNEAVQKDLGVNDVIKDAIKEINDTYTDEGRKQREAGGNAFANFQEMSEEERAKAMEKFAAQRTALVAKFTPELKDALTAEQFKRLKEIHVQAMRDQAYTDADVVKALALKKEQTDKIAEINKDFATKSREAFQPGGGGGGERPDFNAMRTKAEEMGKARDGKLSDVLTADQKAKLKELKGKEFDVAQLQQRGFGGPGGGAPGGAGGGRPGAGGRPGGGRPPADAPKADAPKAE